MKDAEFCNNVTDWWVQSSHDVSSSESFSASNWFETGRYICWFLTIMIIRIMYQYHILLGGIHLLVYNSYDNQHYVSVLYITTVAIVPTYLLFFVLFCACFVEMFSSGVWLQSFKQEETAKHNKRRNICFQCCSESLLLHSSYYAAYWNELFFFYMSTGGKDKSGFSQEKSFHSRSKTLHYLCY